jgi:predicted NUDIX family NTP pyrophosphohydrolase
LLVYRRGPDGTLEVFLAHPGGPFWANKDLGHWTVPKGEPDPDEPLLDAARREFTEETGLTPPPGPYLELGQIVQKGGKHVHAWAVEGDADPNRVQSSTTRIEWPPRSRRFIEIPEVDRCAWFDLAEARRRIKQTQIPLLDRLEQALGPLP